MMQRLQIQSPDVCDALMMTFMRKSISKRTIESQGQKLMDQNLRKKRRKRNMKGKSYRGI